MIKDELKKRNLSIYKCSKMANIPYTTLLELVNNKSCFENCSIKTISKLSAVLNISISDLISNELEYRMPFEEFRSETCHKLKSLGDIKFIKYIYENNLILNYYNKSWYEESFYLLALIDYISEKNCIPVAKEYNFIRNQKLKNTVYPRDTNLLSTLNNSAKAKKEAQKNAIPSFLKYNIVETNVYNVG